MKRPRIGINCKIILDKGDHYFKLDRNYVRSVHQAGGMPLLMPAFLSAREAREFLSTLDGVLLTGGPDINPCRWGETPHPKTEILHPDRERSDFWTLQETLRQDKPFLAICCGCQELNVALGGSLHQHVEDLPGVRRHAGGVRHTVEVAKASRTRDILGASTVRVNSWHHQACHRLGRGLLESARSPDGLVEGLESPRHRFAIGVQWHPERMPDDPRQQALFRALVSEAKRP
jgi:putative glutamine amidotransferase